MRSALRCFDRTWQASLCSLARAGAEFVACDAGKAAKKRAPILAICFRHASVRGTAMIAAYSNQSWKEAKYLQAMTAHPWDVLLPNLGMHFNLDGVVHDGRRRRRQ